MTFDLQQLAQLSAQGLLNSIAGGLAIALFAGGLLKVLGKRNSGTRFAVWFSALLAIAALPIFSLSHTNRIANTAPAAFTAPGSWAIYLLGAWGLISTFALLRVAFGVWHLLALRRSCTPLNVEELDPVLQAIVRDAQRVRSVSVCVSERLQVPTAIGFFRPVVVLPGWTLQELSTAELGSILTHELAHLRRWDDWTNLAQKLFRAVLFFHPAVWWVESKLSVEREMACDEIVLAKTDAKSYAKCLVRLAEKNYMRRGLAMAQAAVDRAGQTAQRLAQILDVNRPVATLVSKPVVALVGVFAAGCFAVAPHAPKIVAFGDGIPAAAMAMRASAPVSHAFVGSPLHAEKATAKVVPASFVASSAPQPKAAKKTTTRRNSKPAPFSQEPKLQLARTAAPDASRNPQASFVVMQTRQQFNQAGPDGMIWTLTVWRVTVIQRNQPTEPALNSKST